VKSMNFVVPGPPVAWARRIQPKDGGKPFTPKPQENYKGKVIVEFLRAAGPNWKPWDGPVSLWVVTRRELPKSAPKWMREHAEEILDINVPDWDNLGKLVSDALNGIAYVDDRRASDAGVEKRHAKPGEERVIVELQFHNRQTAADFRKGE